MSTHQPPNGRKLDLRLPADLDYFMRSQKYPEPVKDAQGRCLHYRYIHDRGFYQCFDCGWLDQTDIQDHPAPDSYKPEPFIAAATPEGP